MLPPARIAIAGCIERARYPPVLRTLDYRVGAVVGGDLARNAHQESAEILPAQEPDEGPRRVLESLNHNLAIFDSSLEAETSRMKSPTSRPRSGTGRQAQKVRYFLDLSAARGRERISAIFALSVGRFPCRYALRSGSLSFPQKISSSTA